MRPFGRLIPALEARRRLVRAVVPIRRVEPVPVEAAFDRVAAGTVRAPRPVPSFLRATWDGYALRGRDSRGASSDRPVELTVVGERYAESPRGRRIHPGECVAIATGGALPPGADTVVIFEEVERAGDRIVVRRSVPRGDRLARPGDDIARGTVLVRAGARLGPADVGAIAACGIARVSVAARPIVEVVPNGTELAAPGAPDRPGTVYESNNAALAAVIRAAGAIPRLRPPLPDDPDRIASALRAALGRADLVIATGGSSVGEHDHLPRLLPTFGRLLFHGIAVRPGKPTLAVRTRDGRLLLGLPGHPTSCLANMVWLVLPALRRLARRAGPGWTDGWAILGADAIAPTPGLSTVVPLARRGDRAYPTFRGSSAIRSLAGVAGFTVLPPGRRRLRAGDRVRVAWLDLPLGPDRASPND